MSLVVNRDSIVLSPSNEITDTSSFGILAYQTNVNFSGISATSEEMTGPASNMANPATAYSWTATSTASQTITITNAELPVDYIGIARHNLNQAGLTMRIQFDGVTVSDYAAVNDAQALMFFLAIASPDVITIDIIGASEPVTIAVLYAGRALLMERSIYVGHTPITYGRDRKAINGISENGQYLGEIVVSSSSSTNVSLSNLTPEWYRESLDPFFAQSPRIPAFWAWKPSKYPAEVGFVWVTGNPRPENSVANGMMSISFDLTGIS